MGEFIIGVFNTSLVMGLSIVAAGILLRVSRKRYSAGYRKRIWIFMGICLLIPFHLFRFPGAYTAEVPDLVLREFESRTANGAGGQGITGGAWQPAPDQTAGDQPAQNQALPNPAPQGYGQGASKTELTVADVLFAVWACVSVLLAAYFAVGYRRMRSKIRRWSSECGDGHVQEVVREIAAQCKLKRIPEVRIMKDSEEGPFTTGVLKNIIILPDDALHERDLRFILKHEMIHCRNNDILWRLFFLAVNIIHWFNPLVWYLRRTVEQDMEIACDEEVVVLASREDRKEYGDVIMSWVERSSYKGSAVSTGYVSGVKFLKRRFDSIFNGGKKKNSILLAGGVCVLALFIGCVIQLQSGGTVYAKKKIAIDRGQEVKTDLDGDGKTERVLVTDTVAGDNAWTQLCAVFGDGEIALVNYPDYWGSYLVTGDLTGNGAADIVLVKIAWGSVHYSGELTVLHMETDETGKPELVEYPGNFIQNPNLEPKWVDWENYTGPDEYIHKEFYDQQPTDFDSSGCQGATIIEKNGKTMLRLVYLVDGWTDSSACIDCTYTADGWYIEDMWVIYAYGGSGWEEKLLSESAEPEGASEMKLGGKIAEDANIPLDGPIGINANSPQDDPMNAPVNVSGTSSGNISGSISIKDFWKTVETGNSGTVKFATGLEIVFPEEWQGKTVLYSEVYSSGAPDNISFMAICEKGNAEAGIGGDVFLLWFSEYTQDMIVSDWVKVLGLYRQGGKEYVLTQDYPHDRCYSEDDQELIDAYLKLYETIEDVVIKTDNMPGFTKCGIEDLEWVRYESDM